MPPRPSRILDDDDVQFLTERSSLGPRNRRSSSSCTIDFAEDDLEIIEDVFREEVIDLTDEDHDFSRHSLLDDREISLGSYSLQGASIKAGMLLEIQESTLGKHRITFLLVRVIVQLPGRGQVKFRGVPLARTRHVLAKLPKKPNELCMIIHYNDRDDGTGDQGLIDVAPAQVIGQRTINFTNAVWPQHHVDVSAFRHIPDHGERARSCERSASLTCR